MARISMFLPVVILFVALPGALAFLYVKVTDDQSMRPLGITKETLASVPGAEVPLDITVQIDWGVDVKSAPTRAQVQDALSDTLTSLYVDHHFEFHDVPGSEVLITYVVAPNRIGPYTFADAALGIRAAAAALHMNE